MASARKFPRIKNKFYFRFGISLLQLYQLRREIEIRKPIERLKV